MKCPITKIPQTPKVTKVSDKGKLTTKAPPALVHSEDGKLYVVKTSKLLNGAAYACSNCITLSGAGQGDEVVVPGEPDVTSKTYFGS